MMVSHSCMYMICISTCNIYTHITYIHIYIHPWLSVCFYATYPPFTGNQNPTMGWLAMVGGLLQVTQIQVQNTNELKSHPNIKNTCWSHWDVLQCLKYTPLTKLTKIMDHPPVAHPNNGEIFTTHHLKTGNWFTFGGMGTCKYPSKPTWLDHVLFLPQGVPRLCTIESFTFL